MFMRSAGLGLALATSAMSLEIGGGGSGQTDCLLTVVGNFNDPIAQPRRYRCTDGDPACDADGLANGRCEIAISVCANSTFDPTRCTMAGIQSSQVEHALDNGDPKFDPEFQALQSRIDNELEPPVAPTALNVCTNPVVFHVLVKGPFKGNVCKRNRKDLRINTYPPPVNGKQLRDQDRIRLQCDPPVPCDPGTLFTGTFDRIQRQIFNPSCAISACHDSQSQQNDLLLEQGASLSNLVNVDPFNTIALGLGWKRVLQTSPTTGDATNSYLYRKVANDLPAGTGARMPLGMQGLDSTLIEVIRLWIEAGAPASGWVPGTM